MILRKWFEEVWNKGSEAAIDELLSADAQIHNLMDSDGEKISDIQSFKKMFRAFRSAFSEINVTVEHELTQGNMSAAHCIITGVHSGDGLGRVPHNHPIYFTGMCMVQVQDGKIIQSWNYFDFETMYQQME
jgi:predicted ester cyclase